MSDPRHPNDPGAAHSKPPSSAKGPAPTKRTGASASSTSYNRTLDAKGGRPSPRGSAAPRAYNRTLDGKTKPSTGGGSSSPKGYDRKLEGDGKKIASQGPSLNGILFGD